MLIAYVLRRAFKIEYYLGENEDIDEYLLSNSTALTYDYFLYNFPYKVIIDLKILKLFKI